MPKASFEVLNTPNFNLNTLTSAQSTKNNFHISLTKSSKAKLGRKYQKQQEFTTKPTKRKNTKFISKKNQGGVKCELASKLSLVSGNYHEPAEPVVMVMASIDVKIRHVFADTPLTEESMAAAPPGNNIAQLFIHICGYAY